MLINISGSVSDINFDFPKPLEMYVGGNIIDSTAIIQNLHPTDTSVISAGGEILDHSNYVILTLPSGETPDFNALDQFTDTYLNAFTLLPAENTFGIVAIPNPNLIPALANLETRFDYLPATGSLLFKGVLSLAAEQALLHMRTPFLDASSIKQLYAQSLPEANNPLGGYLISGPGNLEMSAASMDLGNSVGIISEGFNIEPVLAPYTPRGADIDISVAGDLTMLSSAIDSEYGGDINITAGGAIDLGSSLVPATGNVGHRQFVAGQHQRDRGRGHQCGWLAHRGL